MEPGGKKTLWNDLFKVFFPPSQKPTFPGAFIKFAHLCEAPLTQETMSLDKEVTGVNVSVSLIIETMLLHFVCSVRSVLHRCLTHILGTRSTLYCSSARVRICSTLLLFLIRLPVREPEAASRHHSGFRRKGRNICEFLYPSPLA